MIANNKVEKFVYMFTQQDEVMSELLKYANTNPPPSDSLAVLATERYLRALNDIFERTLLGKKTRIFRVDGAGMQRLNKGFVYFKECAEELIKNDKFQTGMDSKQFIAWQVRKNC